ncbi:MAG TPA: GNAT family N-acetyltransferase [Verrucomicrobiae bacterium]
MITEESFLDFKCPHCEETVSFPHTDAGFARACPNCTETVVVPEDGSDLGGKLPLPIVTPRLHLRRFAPGDWKDLLEFMTDEELFRYVGGGPMEEDDLLRWLEAEVNVKLTTPEQMFYLGLVLKEEGKLIGYIGLRFADPLQAGLIIVLSRGYQGKGFAAEAVQGLLEFCFKGIKLHRLTARIDSRNTAAAKLFEHVGMRREGEFVKDTPTPEGWCSSAWYALREEEFLRKT